MTSSWKYASSMSVVARHPHANYIITRTSWRLKSPLTRLFIQQLVQANIKENIKTLHYWPLLVKEFHSWFPSPRAGSSESMSVSCRHHGDGLFNDCNLICMSYHDYDVIKWKYTRVTVLLCGKPPFTGGFHSKRDNNADLWCFFVVSLNKLLNKHSRRLDGQ